MKVKLLFSLDPYEKLLVADARNLLFNYLFSRHHHGHLLLRLDDCREHSGTATALDAARWLGIDWEGCSPTGEQTAGVLRMSERLAVYRQYAQKLVDTGHAYYCFCSRDTLRDMFTQQKIHGHTPHYDGRCLRLAASEREALRAAETPCQIRLKKPEVVTEVHDLVRGKLVFDPLSVADLVILRFEGIPALALANVVDNKVEEVTHVMRGDRLKGETPREAFLSQAFGLKQPEYVHIPLLLGDDRSLLSERHADKFVEDYRAKGYLPDALINYLASHGYRGAFEEQLKTLGALVKGFKVDEIAVDPSVWSMERLQSLNRLALDRLKDDALVHALEPYVKQAGYDILARGDQWARDYVSAIRPGLKALSDVKDYVEVFFADKFTPDKKSQLILKEPEARKIVEALEAALEKVNEVTVENYRELLDAARAQLTAKGRALVLVRVALTGVEVGPEFSKLLPLLGKQRMLARLDNARRYIPKGMKRDS